MFDILNKTLQFFFRELNVKINIKVALSISVLFLLISGIVLAAMELNILDRLWGQNIGVVLLSLSFVSFYSAVSYQDLIEKQNKQAEIIEARELVFNNPDKPQYAWDLARAKLEGYLDRNLKQVTSIYWLTLVVMIFGFGFILYGLYNAFNNVANLPVSIVASASGVIITFIGGSLLIIYKSVLTQSKDYVTVLERINAVGMAVQVIESIPDNASDMKNESMAELARQLLTLYATKQISKDI